MKPSYKIIRCMNVLMLFRGDAVAVRVEGWTSDQEVAGSIPSQALLAQQP